MSKPTDRRDAAALKWKPRLKNAPRGRRSTSTSATTHVADRALSAMRRIDRERTSDGAVDESCAARLAGHFLPQDAAVPSRRVAARPAGSGRRTALVAVGAIAAACLGAMFVAWPSGSSHTVAGSVYLERKPLGAAELRFHPGGDNAAVVAVVAAPDGRFRLADLAAGSYRVTIHPPGGSTIVPLAAAYTSPETTPLQVHLTRDVERLQLYASRVVPKPRQAAWTPGID